jgi:hypothetical protein
MKSGTHVMCGGPPGRRESVLRPRAFVRVLLFGLLALVHAAGAGAQTLATGILQGVVRDEAGRPLNAVTITITNRSNGQRLITRSNRSGTYSSDLLTPGRYDALYELLGYVPQVLEDILISAGSRRDLGVRLEAPRGPIERRVGTSNAALTISGQAGPDRYLTTGTTSTASMPFDAEGLGALLRIATMAGSRHEVLGLPASLTGVVVDGIPLIARSRVMSLYPRDVGLPLSWFSHVGLVTSDVDVEYPGSAAGYLIGYTRRGGRQMAVHGFGDFTSEALASGDQPPASFSSYRAGALVQGSIVRDTASFIVGGEILRSRTPFAPFWANDSTAGRIGAAAQEEFGIGLESLTQPSLSTLDRTSAFGRFDFAFSETSSLSLRGFFSEIPEPEPVEPWTGIPLASAITPRFREILGTATMVSHIDDQLLGEVNLGLESSRMAATTTAGRGQALPGTTIVDAGYSFGSNEAKDITGEQLAFYARGALHIQSGSHWRKIGLTAWLPNYKLPLTLARSGEFLFANVPDFRDSFGYYRTIGGSPSTADFSMRRISLVGQDAWRPNPGLEIVAGLRVTSFTLPDDSTQITPNQLWFALTGLSNFPVLSSSSIELEPRFQMTVNPGGRTDIQLRAGIAVDADIADPGILAEAINDNGGFIVNSGFGQLQKWPRANVAPVAPSRGNTLVVLGPKFRGPRTTRAFGSVTLMLGAQGAISAGVTVRRTEFLPQRVDLNLQPVASSQDQFERPIYGRLEKRGSLLIAEPDSNRRFGGFEHVWGLQAAGQSRYFGLDIMAERPLIGPLGLFASYTYSSAKDDWLIGSPSDPFTQLRPFSDGDDADDWEDGRSDLDVPHRIAIGAEGRLEGSVSATLSALFRYQSGYPFTPGFRAGVDANADGSWHNDPAYIDESIAGTGALLDSWPCLKEDAGGFAQRNACRGPSLKSLDARLAVTLRRAAGYSATFVLDGLNLMSSDDGIVDRAVYLLDPARNLEFSADGKSVTVPLVANPRFGQLLTRFAPQRHVRLGLRVSF